MAKKENKKENNYEFKISDTEDAKAVILADDTRVVFTDNVLAIAYPTKKFKDIFELQFDKEHIMVQFDEVELKALLKGFMQIIENDERKEKDDKKDDKKASKKV